MKQPMFSILVPVYNAVPFLDECVKSLVEQSIADYEIILVNDGSSDGSGACCDLWQNRYPEKIRVIHQENQGAVLARAAALRAAAGSYLVFVDSDDVLHTDALKTLEGYLCRYGSDLVLYNLSSKPDFSVSIQQLPFRDGEVMNLSDSQSLRETLLGSFLLNSLCMKCVSREIACADRDYKALAHIWWGDDLVISLPMMEKAKRIVYCDQSLYYYRQNPQSVTNNYNPKLFRSVRDALQHQRSCAQKYDSDGSLTLLADKNALWYYYVVIAEICLSGLLVSEKKKYLLEVISEPEFERVCVYSAMLRDAKAKLTVWLAKHRLFAPLYLYGFLNRLRK